MDEITKDVSLIVTDFSDEEEIEEAKLLWDSLISDLKASSWDLLNLKKYRQASLTKFYIYYPKAH